MYVLLSRSELTNSRPLVKCPIYCRVGMLAPAYSASGSVQLNTGDFCMNTENSMSSVTEMFRVFDWLKNYEPISCHIRIRKEKLSSVLPFCLMWNLFESKFCNKDANSTKIKKAVITLHSSNKLMKEDIFQYLNYFKNRYLEPPLYDHTNTTFERLKLRKKNKELVESVLIKGEKTNCTLLLQALLIIVYRFRNNLFHGEKEVSTLHSQNENFYVANHLLAKVLDLQQFNSVTA